MTKAIISFAEIASRNKILADYKSGLVKQSCLNVKPKIKSIILPALHIPEQLNLGGPSLSSNVIFDFEEIVIALLIGIGVAIIVNEIDEYIENYLEKQKLNKV